MNDSIENTPEHAGSGMTRRELQRMLVRDLYNHLDLGDGQIPSEVVDAGTVAHHLGESAGMVTLDFSSEDSETTFSGHEPA